LHKGEGTDENVSSIPVKRRKTGVNVGGLGGISRRRRNRNKTATVIAARTEENGVKAGIEMAVWRQSSNRGDLYRGAQL
jgi:hypothetical protein